MAEAKEHVDVLIVGAGLSGVGAGYHLQSKCPTKSYVILEGRDCIGGTWDLFRYPRHPFGQRHVHARLFVQALD
ncbi:cation diffusion facilitator CzcD-associated flavoprotein CzcO [Bradyrhizobium diazoefficiens]